MNFSLKYIYRQVAKLAAVSSLTTLTLGHVFANDMPGEGVSITPVFPSVAEERFRGEVTISALQALGYTVKTPKETEYAGMMPALVAGEADFTVHLWDNLHDSFYQKVGGDGVLVKAGDVIPGVLQGYLIDKKTAEQYDIQTLEDLKKPDIARLFDVDGDGKADLTGCNAGWGCEQMINHHLKAYGLEGSVTHHRGPYFPLMAETIARYQTGKPVLYYTWVPQWISGVLVEGKDVTWLEVPQTDLPDGNNYVDTYYDGKNLGFPIDQVIAVMAKPFSEQNIAATALLSRVQISAADESAQNLKMKKGENSAADIKRHAKEWIAANQATFDGWLQHARTVEK